MSLHDRRDLFGQDFVARLPSGKELAYQILRENGINGREAEQLVDMMTPAAIITIAQYPDIRQRLMAAKKRIH